MKDNSDIPLPIEELRSRVMVFAIMNEANNEYEEVTKGYVEIGTDQDLLNEYHYLEVKDESTNDITMRSVIGKESNLGKQKGTIISWTDPEQAEYHDLALSFETEQECDIFWRSICEKIGKSYLEINGEERLEVPTTDNMKQLLEKARSSVDLVDYNLVHSRAILEGLREVYRTYKSRDDEMGCLTVLRFINSVFSMSYSTAAIQSFLVGENFPMLLELQSLKHEIDFCAAYAESIAEHLKNPFNLPEEIFSTIQLSHRSTFYRENVLNLADEAKLESIMFMICKEAQVKILGYINRSNSIEKIVEWETPSESGSQTDLAADKLKFLLECLVMYGQMTSEQIKSNFRESLYSGQLLGFVQAQIEAAATPNSCRAIEILYYIASIDPERLFNHLVNDNKKNSTHNLWKVLTKSFASNPDLATEIEGLLSTFYPVFNRKPEHFNFFVGTFFLTLARVSANTISIIHLTNSFFLNVENPKALMQEIVKSKFLERVANEYRTGPKLKRKSEELAIVKLLKSIIVELDRKKQHRMVEIEKACLDSGFFECCMMIYFKHSERYNIISSSMLENLKIIEKMDYSTIDTYIIREYSEIEALSKLIPVLKEKHINYVNKRTEDENALKFKQVEQVAHQSLLENEQQDDYLMGQSEGPAINGRTDHSAEQNDTESLENLKRMRAEIGYDEQGISEAEQNKTARKAIKRSNENSAETTMLCFDLPDMGQLEGLGS